MKKQLLYFLLALSITTTAMAQEQVTVFADTRGNDSLQKLVELFREQLKRSQWGSSNVQPVSAYAGRGIYINTTRAANQPVKPGPALLAAGPEGFLVNADEQTVQIIGNSNRAIGHGIFSYLDFIGFRFYFPNADWHIIPVRPNLYRKWKTVSTPSLEHRRIWYGYGTGSPRADADYQFWIVANRMGGTVNASFGHSYEEIISRNRETFLKHPEWFYPVAPKGTIPTTDPKFDVSREDLVQFIIRDVEKRIEASLQKGTEEYKMISLAPSDGLGTCDSPECRKLGNITDRVFYLVNRVAKAIAKKYPSTYIGCLAYGEYSVPPTKPIEPNVFVGITTAFNASSFSTEQLVEEWRKKGANVGIYDYFSWYAWDFDIPGQSLASRPGDIVKSVKKYQAMGVKAYDAESSIGWVGKGLGYYLAARQMWDARSDIKTAQEEFFRLSFGSAAPVMQQLWKEWEQYSFMPVRESDLARWIDYAAEAGQREKGNTAVEKRLFQLRSYLHYLYLYGRYHANRTEQNLLPLLSYAYRKLDDGSVGGYPAFWELGNRSGIPGLGFTEDARWRNDKRPVTVQEINDLMRSDRAALKVIAPVKSFDLREKLSTIDDLGPYKKQVADSALTDNKFWLTNEWVIQVKNKGGQNYLDIYGDYIGDKNNTKPIRIAVYPHTPDGKLEGITPLLTFNYSKKLVKERMDLGKLEKGFYTLVIQDPVKAFRADFSSSLNYSVVMRPGRQVNSTALFYAFLYVPKGVTRFNLIKTSLLTLVTPTGRELVFAGKAEEVQVEVKKGEEGLWRIKQLYDKLYVEGIPPFLGTSPRQMLVPKD